MRSIKYTNFSIVTKAKTARQNTKTSITITEYHLQNRISPTLHSQAKKFAFQKKIYEIHHAQVTKKKPFPSIKLLLILHRIEFSIVYHSIQPWNEFLLQKISFQSSHTASNIVHADLFFFPYPARRFLPSI